MSLENNEDSSWFPHPNKEDGELTPEEKLNELESSAKLEVEVPLGQLEEQDIADDPVRI